jgi:hypothetical protein
MRFRKPLIWIAGIAGTVVLLIALVVLSAPLWFDSEGVKTRVVELLAKATGGNAQFERIDLSFVPPGATVTRPRFSLPGVLDLDAQSGSIDLDLLALFTAHIRVSTVSLVAPTIVVQIPEPAQQEEPLSIETADQAAREVLAQLAERAPNMQITVEDGSVSLLASGRQALSFDDFQLHAETTSDRIEATVSCTSNLWDHLTLKVNLADGELTGNGTVEMVGLRAHDLGPFLGQDETWPIRNAVTDANLQWQMKGLTDILAEGNLSASKVSLRLDERELDLQRPTIDVSAHFRNGATEILVRQLVLDYPRLDATAKLTRSEPGEYMFQATATDVDLSALQATAAALSPGVALLARTSLNIEQGTITTVQMTSEADTLVELWRPRTLHAQLELAAVDALVPDHDIRIREASGTVSLKAGELEIRNATARVGKSVLSDANVSASLSTILSAPTGRQSPLSDEPGVQETDAVQKNAKPIPLTRERIELIAKQLALSAEARLSLDLAEVLAMAKHLMRDGKTQPQLDEIEQLSGRADFHTSVTTDSQKPEVRLDVSGLKTTLRHAKVPFAIPIRLTRGGLRYVDDGFYAQDLDGAVGNTTFKDVGTRFGIKAPNALSASKGSANLALDELMRWANALPDRSEHLAKIKKITGTLAVSVTKLEGPLRSPDKLRYALSATPKRVSIDAPTLGPRAQLNGGAVDVSHASIRMHDVTLSSLDASLRVGGEISNYRDGLTNLQARINGSAGLKSLEWLRERAGLPETMQLRNPLQISRFDAKWRRDGELAARGKFQVSDGPAIGFAMRISPDHIEVEHVTLRDEISEVDAGGKLEDTHFDVRFKGKLVEQSLARIFTQLPMKFGELNGDIRATGDWKQPDRTAATGALHGTMIGIPAALLIAVPVPVTIENFSLEGQNRTLLIKSATVAMGDSRVDVSGSIGTSGDQFLLDVDVRGDKVVVPLPTAESPSGSKAAPEADAMANTERTIDQMTVTGQDQMETVENILDQIRGSGQIQIHIGQLHIGRQVLTPFIAAASLENKQLILKLQQTRICNILLTGGLTAVLRGRANLNVEVHTRDTSIERSVPCLTNQNILMTGLMDIDAKFVATGSKTEYLESLQVTYALSAHDGVIRKFDALGEVLVAVNETDAAKGKLPDLGDSSLNYKTLSAKGSIDLKTLRFDEVVVDIDSARIVAQGTVDIATEKINATVLVAPVKTINKIINRLPLLGRIFGGNLLAVPVGVSGTITEPTVLPLAPTAVAGRMIDILNNTLRLPADLLNTTTPETETPNPPAATGNSGRGG